MSPHPLKHPLSHTLLHALFALLAFMLPMMPAHAAPNPPSSKEASAGIKDALTRGAEHAVAQLGKTDGFLGNSKVRIPLPESLQPIEALGRSLGLNKQMDELVTTMNRAAESAVTEAKPLLVQAVRNMSVRDAYDILGGSPDAATQYFRKTTSRQLSEKIRPLVHQATARLKVTEKYNTLADKAARLKLIDASEANLDTYVTQKTLDGLFLMIAEQEQQIRDHPLDSGSKLLQKVFGSGSR